MICTSYDSSTATVEKFKAPEGKFRVIGVDTFDGTDWIEGDFDTFEKAKAHMFDKTAGEQMLKMHVYDDQGKHCGEEGTF